MKKRTVRKRKRGENRKPMPGEALRAWRTEMGYSERLAAEKLGMSHGGLRNAERFGASRYIALACAALYNNIKPWGIEETDMAGDGGLDYIMTEGDLLAAAGAISRLTKPKKKNSPQKTKKKPRGV